jgi:hypothetical protein
MVRKDVNTFYQQVMDVPEEHLNPLNLFPSSDLIPLVLHPWKELLVLSLLPMLLSFHWLYGL